MDLAALDAALVRLGLLPASRSGRPLEQRIAGAQRLFYKQGAALVIQIGYPAVRGSGSVRGLRSEAAADDRHVVARP